MKVKLSKDFTEQWMDKSVSFMLFGVKHYGIIREIDSGYKTVKAYLNDGEAIVTVAGHFTMFKKCKKKEIK